MYSLKTTSTLNLALNSYVVSFPNVLYSCSVGTSMCSVETTFWSLARDYKIWVGVLQIHFIRGNMRVKRDPCIQMVLPNCSQPYRE